MKNKCPQKTIYHAWNNISLNFPVTEKYDGEKSVTPLLYQYTNSYPRQQNSMESGLFFFTLTRPWSPGLLYLCHSDAGLAVSELHCSQLQAVKMKCLSYKHFGRGHPYQGNYRRKWVPTFGKKRIYLQFKNSKMFLDKILFFKQLFGEVSVFSSLCIKVLRKWKLWSWGVFSTAHASISWSVIDTQ